MKMRRAIVLITMFLGVLFLSGLISQASADLIGEEGFIAPGAQSYVFDLKWGSYGTLNDEFNHPDGIAVDPSGNVYVADRYNHRIMKFDSSGNFLFSFGAYGSGAGQFNQPRGIDIDANGNIWVADIYNNRVQKLNSSGQQLCEVGGFTQPHDVAVHRPTGNVFVANRNAHAFRRLDNNCNDTGGWGSGPGGGDTQFNYPDNIAVDSAANVYVSDTGNHRISKWSPSGLIYVFTAKWGVSGGGDSRFAGPQFNSPNGIEIDGCGDVYVADTYNHRIQKFKNDGTFVTMWGWNGSGDGQLNAPSGIAVDGAGRVYVNEWDGYRVQRFSPSPSHVTHLFKGKWGSYGNTNGQFNSPYFITVDGNGNVYVGDYGNHRIQKFDASGAYITQWGGYGSGNGQFNGPLGIATDNAGNVYVTDHSNHRVQKFNSSGVFLMGIGQGTTWTGAPPSPASGTANGWFKYPEGIAVDPVTGDIYVADRDNQRIQKFNAAGGFVMGIGNGITWSGAAPTPAAGNLNSWFSSPKGVEVDASGNLYVADIYNHRIQKFDSSGVFLNKWGALYYPEDVTVDGNGNVYVGDTSNHRIIKFTSEGRIIHYWGNYGAGAPPPDGLFNAPRGVAVDPTGDFLYVADRGNHRIQRFERFGYSMSSNPTSQVIVRPDVTTYTLTLNGVSANTLSTAADLCILSGLPSGMTSVSFSPASLTPSSSGPVTSTLTLDTSNATPLGTYNIFVQARGGGQTRVVPISLQVKSGPPTITNLKGTPDPFSPNGDGKYDTTTITATFKVPLNWNLDIKSGTCPGTTVVRNFSGYSSSLSQVWDGKDSGSATVPDGDYCYVAGGTTPGGISAAAVSYTGKVDTTKPVITGVSDSPDPFDPEGAQTTTISYTLSEDAKVTIKIYLGSTLKRTLLNKVSRTSGANAEVWDGKDNIGGYVPNGTYTYKITAEDAARNISLMVSGKVTKQ